MTVVADITMSVDGFVTGPHDGQGRGLGEGGERLHNWVMGGPWTYAGGSPFQAKVVDREVLDEALGAVDAIIIGRRMYDVVDGWGDSSPFDRPVFVVTSPPHPHRVAARPATHLSPVASTTRWPRPGRPQAARTFRSAAGPASSSSSWPRGWSAS